MCTSRENDACWHISNENETYFMLGKEMHKKLTYTIITNEFRIRLILMMFFDSFFCGILNMLLVSVT